MGTKLDSIKLDCEKETARLQVLQQERMKQEALVKHFENNNEEYIIITKTVEEKVVNSLSNSKKLLKMAILSLAETMRSDPAKYSSIIHYIDKSSSLATVDYTPSQHYAASYMYGPLLEQPHLSQSSYIDILIEEAEKLYNRNWMWNRSQ
jgi:hypothetical protein